MNSPTYRLTYWDGTELERDVRYGDLTSACESGMLWSSKLAQLVEVRDHKGVRVAWVDLRGPA